MAFNNYIFKKKGIVMRKATLFSISLIFIMFVSLSLTGNAFAKSKELRVGVVGPLTGPSARTGVEFKSAVELAFEAIDYKIGDYKVKLIWIDSESDPEKATRAYERAVLRDKIDVGILNWHSSVSVALMPITSRMRIPHFFGIGATGVVNDKFNSNRDRFGYWTSKGWPIPTKTTEVYALALEKEIAKGAWSPKNKKIIIATDDTDWGHSTSKGMKANFEKFGWEVVNQDYIRNGETDFYPLLTKYKRQNASLVIASISAPPSAAAFIKQFKEIGLDSLLVSDGLGDIGEWHQMTGKASNGILDSRGLWASEKGKAFAETYEKKYNNVPSPAGGGLVYDYTRFFIKICNETLKDYGKLDKAVLFKVAKEKLWTGKITFTDGVVMNEYVYKPETLPDPVLGEGKWGFPVIQYVDGKSIVVWPESVKTGDFTLPQNLK